MLLQYGGRVAPEEVIIIEIKHDWGAGCGYMSAEQKMFEWLCRRLHDDAVLLTQIGDETWNFGTLQPPAGILRNGIAKFLKYDKNVLVRSARQNSRALHRGEEGVYWYLRH